jgi:hypothetical protein
MPQFERTLMPPLSGQQERPKTLLQEPFTGSGLLQGRSGTFNRDSGTFNRDSGTFNIGHGSFKRSCGSLNQVTVPSRVTTPLTADGNTSLQQ